MNLDAALTLLAQNPSAPLDLAELALTLARDEHPELSDIDLARVTADPALVAAMDRLPGRKFVFTNASEDYARRVLDRHTAD